jgi:glycosyltransferase involved in cell wall biosynthesis
MNILFISPNSPYESVGGIERYILNLIEYFKDLPGYNTTIILPTTKKNYSKSINNVKLYFDNNINLGNTSTNQQEISSKAFNFSKVVESIIVSQDIKIICAENFHVGLPPAYALLLNMVAGLNNIPLVLRLHSFAKTDLQTELINQLMWSNLSCVSKSVAGDCFHKGANINTVSTDYLGINTNLFYKDGGTTQMRKKIGLPNGCKVLLTATRIIEGRKNILQEKGLINLIQAFSKLSRYSNLQLLIAVGRPPERLNKEFADSYNMLVGYLKLHGVEERTIIKTFSLKEMPLVYRIADVFVLPSENETFGQVFVESMASGTPVIGTKVGGIPEVISDSYNGFLIPPNDSSILAQRIETLLVDEKVSSSFVEAGLKTVTEKFALDTQFSNFVGKLEQVARLHFTK